MIDLRQGDCLEVMKDNIKPEHYRIVDIDQLDDNLYAFEDTIFNSQQVNALSFDVEWDYVYIEPDVYPLGRNRYLIVNQEGTQAEIAENTNGLLISVGVTLQESMIGALIDIALNMKEVEND